MSPEQVELTVARMDGEFRGMKDDIGEVKRDVRELRAGQVEITNTLSTVHAQLTTLTTTLNTVKTPVDPKAMHYAKMLAYGSIIIAIFGTTGVISVHIEEIGAIIDVLLRAKDAVSLDLP